MGMVGPRHMNGGADAQIVAASPATDVMDDENDKVSQDVVAVPLGSGIHEFQWSQAWRSGLLCSALMSQLGGRASLVTRACQPNMPSSPYLSLSTLSPWIQWTSNHLYDLLTSSS